jgi:ribosomal protein S12 methylthiotransferase accessory factor
VACLSLGDGESWPGAVLGLGADLSPAAAVRKAILEQAQVGLYLRGVVQTGELEIPAGPEHVRSQRDHMAYYIPAERAEALDFWRAGASEPLELGSLTEPETSSLSGLRALLSGSELRLAVVDVTCGCRELDHAAISYSWIRPPSRSRRSTEGGSVPTA